ncbi:uncharacterized protein LOC142232105 [Haematobia irritans]|uniref:uncharacterized protein LOC142232105 n=1 Tax=Haematobia irritans TaxID=7368 RepID=UPI003F50950F
MAHTSFMCRLCVNICNQYMQLCDENGQSNEIYETTVKYFDPMFLSLEQEKQPVICVVCWKYIDDFNAFQKTVILAQSKLLEYTTKTEDVIKSEYETNFESPILNISQVSECIPDPVGEYKNGVDSPKNVINENEKMLINFAAEMDLFDDRDIQFSSEDEKPLVECIERKSKRRSKAISPKKKKENKIKETCAIKVPKKRGRKPKTESSKSKIAKMSKESTDNKNNYSLDEIKVEEIACSNDETEERNGQKLIDTSFGKRTSKEIDEFIAQWKKELDCYLCGGTAPSMFGLRQHFRKEHPNKRCYVLCCQRKLSRRHQLEEHIRVHVDPGAFKCKLCGKCCTNKRTLSNHMYEQHTEQGQERSYECPTCHKCFAKKPVWKRHMEIHEPNKDHICKQCGKGFPTEQRRNVHERMVHNVERVCDQCGKIFRGIYTLRQHLLEHSGVERRKWPCDQCSAQLNTHNSLKRHKQVAHNDGRTVYICSECGKVAPSSVALMSHKKYVHQAPRKFKCTICEKAFKTNLVLREHMASHTGEDLYTCPHCPKTFKVSSNMHHHRKKAHPVEWAEGRLKKPMTATIDMKQVSQEIVM